MPNIAAVLKQEISRLARKEIRHHTQALRRAATQYRKDIAKLKRETSKLQSELGHLARQSGNGATLPVSEENAEGVRFTAKGVRSHRERLGVSAADFGKLIGVSGNTVFKWEHEAARPRKRQLAALAALRGLGKREASARLEELGAKAGNASGRGVRRSR